MAASLDRTIFAIVHTKVTILKTVITELLVVKPETKSNTSVPAVWSTSYTITSSISDTIVVFRT